MMRRYPSFILFAILFIIISIYFLINRKIRYYEKYENEPLKVFFFGFWHDIKPTTHNYLLSICAKTFNRPCIIGNENDSDIIIQYVFDNNTDILHKFKYKIYLFGENAQLDNHDKYDIILHNHETYDKYIALPFFLTDFKEGEQEKFEKIHKTPRKTMPEKDVVVVISNPHGEVRNKFLNELEKHFNITYAGNYKNNTEKPLEARQGTPEYNDYISQYKFVVSMENSEAPYYITEKIFQGIGAQIIPIYWGGKKISEFINSKRFIQLENGSDETIDATISKMKEIASSPKKWLEMVNQHVFTGPNYTLDYTPEKIGKLARKILNLSD